MKARGSKNWNYGPTLEGGHTRFRLWAPDAEVMLEIEGHAPQAMQDTGGGWREARAQVGAGARYRFRVGDHAVPDPASRRQSCDVHDWSVVTNPASYRWRFPGWRGRPWEDAVFYELHPGLLGGFSGVSDRLFALAKLGITAIELMPVADFPGTRNWGYDGVLPFAPDSAYGSPETLKALIDRAHALGLMVFFDVVYNHFGPDGNYLSLYAKRFFRHDVRTPWGDAVDFREPAVRRYFIENALYWLDEFHADGLRLDAVHAMEGKDWLRELASEVRAHFPADRHIHLVLENDDNDAYLLESGFDAQWNDDIHHAMHVLLTGETNGYYSDYAEAPAEKLARALGQGFVYQGDPSSFRGGARRGSPSAHLPPTAFVAFLQNHDQTGNRALGERLTVLAPSDALRAAVALVLLSPQIPLIFMGEEAGAREPFLYFTDHGDDGLAGAVREGRRAEFKRFPEFSDPARRAQIPDPNALDTYERSRPSFRGDDAQSWRDLYRALLGLRATHIAPRLKGARSEHTAAIGPKAVTASWRLSDGARLTLALNLGNESIAEDFPACPPIWGEASGNRIAPMTTLCWIEAG